MTARYWRKEGRRRLILWRLEERLKQRPWSENKLKALHVRDFR